MARPESKRSLAMEKMKSKIFCDIKFPIISLFTNSLQEGFNSPLTKAFFQLPPSLEQRYCVRDKLEAANNKATNGDNGIQSFHVLLLVDSNESGLFFASIESNTVETTSEMT